MDSIDLETAIEVFKFKSEGFDIANFSFLKIMEKKPSAQILPMMDLENKRSAKATALYHNSFSVTLPAEKNSKRKILEFMKDSDGHIKTALTYYKYMTTQNGPITNDMLEGALYSPKEYCICFYNDYNTLIRIWSSERKGDKIIFHTTVATYKDCVWTATK